MAHYAVFLCVFARIAGMFLFNPIFGKKSIPVIIKMGLAFLIALSVSGTLTYQLRLPSNMVEFLLTTLKELGVGFVVGFIIQMFLSSILMAGDVMDLQLGISMSQIYDPQSNINIPLSGNLLSLIFISLFFISNGHLTFIKMIVYSFDVVPPGPKVLSPEIGQYIVFLFGNMFVLALKIAMPVLAVELLLEIGLGILMRAVPQINVFAVGLQMKLLVGLALFAFIMPNLAGAFDNMMDTMFQAIEQGLKLLM